MQSVQSLNLNWYFKQGFDERIISEPLENTEEEFETVHVPHTVQMIPYDCFDQYMTCMISTYVKHFSLPEGADRPGRRVLVGFEGVSACYDLYCNGSYVGSHKGAYSMALFDLTGKAQEGENRLVLRVDSHERKDIPPNGSTVDFLIYGGIYRDVHLYLQQDCYILHPLVRYEVMDGSVVLKPQLLIGGAGKDSRQPCTFTVGMRIRGGQGNEFSSESVCQLGEAEGCDRSGSHPEEAKAYEEAAWLTGSGARCIWPGEWKLPVSGSEGKADDAFSVCLWSPEQPTIYEVCFTLRDDKGELLDTAVVRTGFRSIDVTPDGFFLNGERIRLIGLNRHQSYPYIGYALGRRSQEKDAELLKNFLGVNMVRCSHYMQSRYFLDRCDELGLLVLEEIPGWGYVGGEDFRRVVINDLKNMVLGHYNHPAVVIWGSRLNETADCDELYEKTHRLCRAMDPSRPTTGARWHTGSRLYEEIYSFNDYSEDENGDFVLLTPQEAAGTAGRVPYLISEHSGAIVPTKPWDSEERQEQFALRHAKVLDRVLTMDGYLGALGWCMCDYNTHNDHNSMNKVCYHGVLDMFRVPKMAAFLYASQRAPEDQVILEPCSLVGRGERCEPVPFWVMTNCDYIDVKLSADEVRRYYPSMKYGGMKHPPIEVKQNGEFWQNRWEGARIIGYYRGKEAALRIYSNNPRLSQLRVEADAGLQAVKAAGGVADLCTQPEYASEEKPEAGRGRKRPWHDSEGNDGAKMQRFDMRLRGDIVDETRIAAFFLDENGNRLYSHRGVLQVEISGPLELVGPGLIPVMGGAAAFWIRTKPGDDADCAEVILRPDREELPVTVIRARLR